MLVLPCRLLRWVLSTSDQELVFFQPIFCHPHTQMRTILFRDEQRDIPNLKFSPNHVSIRFSQIAFPIYSPAKRWPSQIWLKKNDGSSILDHDFGHLCRGRRIQMSGHSDFRIFKNLWASSIFPWVQADTASAACPSQPGNLEMISTTFSGCHLRCWRSLFSEYCIRPWIVLYNITSEYNSTFVFLVFCLQFSIFQVTLSTSDTKWTVAPDVLGSSITSFSLLTFIRFHAEIFSNFSHSLSTAAFAAGICFWLKHRNEFVNQIEVLKWILTFSCNMVFVNWRFRVSHTHSGGFISFQNTRKFCFNFVGCTSPTILLHYFTGHSKSNWCFQLLLRAFLMVSLNSLSSGSMKWIPRNFLAFSRWIFSSDHFCFSFSFACFPIDFHNSGHKWSGLDVNCCLVSLTPDQVYPSGALSSSRVNCVKPVQGSDKSREPSMFQ